MQLIETNEIKQYYNNSGLHVMLEKLNKRYMHMVTSVAQ